MVTEVSPDAQASSDSGMDSTDRPAAGQAAPFAASGSGTGRWMFAVGSGILLLVVVGVAVSSLLPSTPDGPQLTYRVVLGDLDVTVTEPGTLESSENTEIRCKVRGQNTITSVVESGSIVKEGEELLRLDTLLIEEQIHERTKYAHW